MKRVFIVLLVIPVYAAAWLVTSSACLATDRADFPDLWGDTRPWDEAVYSQNDARRHRRQSVGFCVGWSATPFAWIVAPVVTGFYADGFLLPWEVESRR